MTLNQEGGDEMPIHFQGDGAASGQLPRRGPRAGAALVDPVGLPRTVLERHGARILRPVDAAVFAGAGTPLSTAYRAAVLLVPDSLLQPRNRELLEEVQRVLAAGGLRLAVEDVPPLERLLPEELERYRPFLRDVLRRAPLVPADGAGPVVVDAWPALQRLRANVRDTAGPLHDQVVRFSLEHLLIGSVPGVDIDGDPVTDGHPVTGGPGGATYLTAGSGGRGPVGLVLPAPRRGKLGDPGLGRRPVVAVLDTGMGPHPWLDASDDPLDDTFVEIDTALQVMLAASESASGDPEPLGGPWEFPFTEDPLVGELDTHTGHGTFIAGIVRQVAPDARVRSVRIMHSDGIVYENDLLLCVAILDAQAALAQSGSGSGLEFVDVLSLSLGYYSESSADAAYTTELAGLLSSLTNRGVLVVCSAGNDSTERPCYPAALAPAMSGLLSVGALNPNGSKALFSNDGPWVRCWADGAAVISTFPTTVDGSQGPLNTLREPNAPGLPQRRETIDPDDFRSGFATWSGTSFAAPLVAAALAAALISESEHDPADDLTLLDPAAVSARAARAVTMIGG